MIDIRAAILVRLWCHDVPRVRPRSMFGVLLKFLLCRNDVNESESLVRGLEETGP